MNITSYVRWVWFLFVFGQLNVLFVQGVWSSPNSSSVELLGLFPDTSDASDSYTSSVHSQAMFKAALILSQRHNITIDGQFIGWKSLETNEDVMDTLSHTCQLISTSDIVGIVGPPRSRESHVIAPFSEKIGIPVVSYGATDPELSDRKTFPTFYRTVPSDHAAALAIVKLFNRFNWTSCVIIYQNDAFGLGRNKATDEAFRKNNLTISQTIAFDLTTRTIRGDLRSLLTSSTTRIVLVWVDFFYTTWLIRNALNADVLGPQFLWILSSSISLDPFRKEPYEKLSGVLTFEPVVGSMANVTVNRALLNAAYDIWREYERETFPGSDKVDDYALFAFDATWLLIQSLAKLCSHTSKNNLSRCVSIRRSSICFDRSFTNANSLFKIIDSTSFLGVSGPIQFNGETSDRIQGAHHIVKNVQRSSNILNYVPVLVWSDSDNWTSYRGASGIVWPGHSPIPPRDYTTLREQTLQIAMIESIPFTIVKEVTDQFGRISKHAVGYMPDLLELLRQRIGFIPNITLVPSNMSYNSLIDAVANGIFDLVVADTTVTARRIEKVAFTSSIYDTSLHVITRKESTTAIDYFSYLKPFSPHLWLTLLAAGILSGFIIFLLEREKSSSLENKPIMSAIGMSMWYSFATILGYGGDFCVTTAAGRLVTMGLHVLSFVLIVAYTANLASNLTILKTKDAIAGIEDIKNGKVPFSRIGVTQNSSHEDYYLREISGNSRNFYPVKSILEIYNKLLDNTIDAAFVDTDAGEYSTNNIYCNLTLVGTDFARSAFAIVSPKNWLYEQELDIHVISLRENGHLDELRRKWFQTNGCSRPMMTSTAMSTELMAGIFLTFGMITLLALVLFVWSKRSNFIEYLSSNKLLSN